MYGAVDIGGTKTLVAVFDEYGDILEQVKIPTEKNYDLFLEKLSGVVSQLKNNHGFKAVGVGVPGRIDRKNGLVISCGNLAWKDETTKADIEKIFECPAVMENDAKMAGYHEAKQVESEFSRVLYLTVSTGIGIALVTDGEINTEIGDRGGKDMIFEYHGEKMAWEDFSSGRAIYNKYGQKASEIEDPETWHEISRNLAIGIIELITTLEPEVIIFGGGVGAHFKKFAKPLYEELTESNAKQVKLPELRGAQNPEEAVVYGCYELAKAHHGKVTHQS